MFDSYFNFIHGGESGVSLFELEEIKKASNSYEDLIRKFHKYNKEDKFDELITRIKYLTETEEFFPKDNLKTIIHVLFDFHDIVYNSHTQIFSLAIDSSYLILDLIKQLLKHNRDLDSNYDILSMAINESKSIYSPVLFIGKFIKLKNNKDILDEEKLLILKKTCSDKIKARQEFILKEKAPIFIIEKWKKWDEKNATKYVEKIFEETDKFLIFFNCFLVKEESFLLNEDDWRFDFYGLENFFNLNTVKLKIQEIKKNIDLYEKNKKSIDLFLDGVDENDFERMFW